MLWSMGPLVGERQEQEQRRVCVAMEGRVQLTGERDSPAQSLQKTEDQEANSSLHLSGKSVAVHSRDASTLGG